MGTALKKKEDFRFLTIARKRCTGIGKQGVKIFFNFTPENDAKNMVLPDIHIKKYYFFSYLGGKFCAHTFLWLKGCFFWSDKIKKKILQCRFWEFNL